MSVTVQGMIGRALMANTPEERQTAEDVATLLMYGARMLADWRSVVVIENGPRVHGFGAREWDAAMGDVEGVAMLAEWRASGGRVIDGRMFTAAGKPRKVKSGPLAGAALIDVMSGKVSL